MILRFEILITYFDPVIPLNQIIIGNCKWAPWHAWSECTSPCGGGTQNRTRDVLQAAANGGEECEGEQAQFRDCNIQKCPSMLFLYSMII